ncbi:hypothetical protein B0T10DRAFT_490931 [Thelonectria olida]|uniref:SnoaL-like domain-containing protein n=1 Tax=Thelonectria olida TaxID=1576542 RepID=A0A9P8W0S0_9HYPO|nr:hypothetical protein B0T10DRAFT_490931 [Thelonectria olida]
MALTQDSDLFSHLREIHHQYRQTPDPEGKKFFYSTECRQICRQDPSYAARERDTIARYLKESGALVNRVLRDAGLIDDASGTLQVKASCYTVRPLTESESDEFGTTEVVAPAGFSSVEDIQAKARSDKWKGLRVNMWTDDGFGKGLLVKVKYWWRLEEAEVGGEVWRQILHDILYLGPRDGTEESEGGILVQDSMA